MSPHYSALEIQWNPSITDTIGNQHLVPYSKVSSGASSIFPVGVVLRNPVKCNTVAFSEPSFAARWQGRKAKQRLVLQVTAIMESQVVNYSSDNGQSC